MTGHAASGTLSGMKSVRFFYDIACPYAYIASTQIEAICAAANASLEWCPILLGGLYRSVGGTDHPAASWPASKIQHNERDMTRQAECFGVPLQRPDCYPQRTVATQRLLLAASPEIRPALTHRLFRAYWVEGLPVGSRAVLGHIAEEFDLDLGCLDDPAAKKALFDATQEAQDLGMFGVPSFQVDDTFYWGADRLHFVARDLGLERLPPEDAPVQDTQPTIEFFHDFASPFSYLGATQIERVAKAQGAKLIYRPILLGALFKDIGTPLIPIFEMSVPRQNYMQRDLREWAKWWNVPFTFAEVFPMRTVTPLRVALQQPQTTALIYDAAWGRGINVGDPENLRALLDGAGFDGQALIKGTQNPEIKAQLFENTQRAIDHGVCGAPSFRVNETTLFWGQDRLGMVEAACSGWVPRNG
ncbi:MAG: 2-hydroxychromene-2-carboxylate isomerase [Myxococcota bacterium]|nr:2-hydroxychromene-2-carboxylate isomerase [Myxococcota bacterium]